MNWAEIASAAVTLFLIMDPFGNAPVFNSVLCRLEEGRRRAVMIRELLIALAILLGFLFAGNAIMGFLGLSQSSLSLTGGVLLFIISLKMIFPAPKTASDDGFGDEPFIVPLAMPLIAGPSTIAVLLLLGSNEPEKLPQWGVALFLAWSVTTALLVSSPFILRLIGEKGSRALERLMGMILVILATQMLLNGITDYVKSLSSLLK
ncbi:MAG: YhgN family NAAT transporter [Pontibacterium sp.]